MIVVTGGAGFIGSNIANTLIKKGYDIYISDFLDHPIKNLNIKDINIKKIINPKNLINFIKEHSKDVEIVIHMGAISSTAEKNLKLLLENNLFFSNEIFKVCEKYSIKLIYASSAATYGDGSNGFNDNNSLLEFSKLSPINYYGLSKHLFDLNILSKRESNKNLRSRPVGLKFFNVFGPNEMHKGFMMSPVPKFYNEIKKEKKLKLFKSHNALFKDGMQSRDFIYVKDCIKIILWFIKNKNKTGIFNIGTGKSESFLKLAEIIFRLMNYEKKIEFIPTPLKIRNGYQYLTKANIKSLRNIGYKNKFESLESSVSDYIINYL